MESPFIALEELNLKGCSVDIHGLLFILQSTRFRTTLKKLSVEKNAIEGKLDKILIFANECTLLAHLNLASNAGLEWDPTD